MVNRGIDTVLDVGANIGQFATSLRVQRYTGRIISFEPVRAVYEALARAARTDTKWDVHNFALGAETGQAPINVAAASVFSSLLPSTESAVAFDESAAVGRTEMITVRRLDDVLPDLAGNVLLKIDTQGFEKQVLTGAGKLLPRLKGIQMELPLVHLYQGNWRFHEAVAHMEALGFVPAQIHAVNYHTLDPVSLVEVDCLFRPLNERIDALA